MSKRRAGLQKKVSSIFDGMPVPKEGGAEQPAGAPTPEHPEYAAPSHLTAPTPKPQRPQPAPPKAAAPKQPSDYFDSAQYKFAQGRPKADATIKTARQIPGQQSLERLKNKLFAPKWGVSATRQKTMVILIPVLFIVLIFVFVRVFSAPSRAVATPPKLGPSSAVAASIHKIDWQIPAPYPAVFRDPMQFGSVIRHGWAQAGTARLIVKGIVHSEDDPTALIGTQIVRQGDKVSGVTIVKINKDSVEFEMNGKKWTQKVQR